MSTARVKDVIRDTERLTGSITGRPERHERRDLREVMNKDERTFDCLEKAPERGYFYALL